VILNLDSTDDDEARIEHSQDGIFGPFSPVATVSPIPEDGLIAVQAQNNEDHCFRVRTVSAGEPQATWSAAECVRVQDDPQEPMLAPELRSSSFNRTLSRTVHVALNAADPPAGTTGDVRRVLPGCDGNVSGVAEMQLSFTDPRTTTVAWQPYQAVATLTLPLPERESYLLYARVRDVAGNESKVATLWIHLDELEFSDIVLYARNFLRISDGARVEMAPDLGIGAVVNSGAGGMLLSPDAVAPNLFSQSNVTMHARSQVLGTVYTGGVFIPSANAVVQGGVNEHALLDLPPMPVTSIPGGSGENITLNSGQSRNLNPGTYGNVTVNSGATLRFNQAGTYVFASLKIQSSSTVLALVGSPLLKVRGTLEFRSSIRRSAGSPLLVFTNIQSNTTGLIVIEAPFSGTVLAPQASLRIGNGSATFNSGSFFARDIEVHPHTTLRHAVTVPPTCSDGVKNGNETDVDCGGATTCGRCANGRTCGAATDCTSGICTGGTCRAQVSATVQVFSDTGSNYCARLRVTNNNSVPTTNWSLTLNYNGSVRTSGTNATFSSNTGTAIVTPAIGHRVIQPGATRDTVTFCANRFGGGTASVVSASGTY
jgi:hypothetical protein